MKKAIGIGLIILFLIAFWVGLSLTLYSDGVNLLWSIVIPFLCYIVTIVINAFCELVQWLLK